MDKTLEIVIAATVIIMTAGALMFMFSDQAGNFGKTINDTQQGASCDLHKTNYELACNCDADASANYETQGNEEAKSKAESESCSWVGDFTCEDRVCN